MTPEEEIQLLNRIARLEENAKNQLEAYPWICVPVPAIGETPAQNIVIRCNP